MNPRLSDLARDLHFRLKSLFDAPLDADAPPLEICQAALDDVERRLEPVGRGRRVFPYTRVIVRVRERHADRPAIEAAFAGFERKLRDRLAELRCEPRRALDVKVVVSKKVPAEWAPDQLFAIEYGTTHNGLDHSLMGPVQITILKGAAGRKMYSFTEPLISIGRTADPTDESGRVRRNRVAFLDTVDGINETVGRAHAQLRYDAETREYRLFDEGSSNGTSIVRDGAAIPVPPRDPRGVRVRSGDEVQIGRAVMRIVIGDD